MPERDGASGAPPIYPNRTVRGGRSQPRRLLGMAPWRRGPLLLARRPGVALALAAAAFVATVPAASTAPFLSASRSATLHHQFGHTCAAKVALHTEAAVNFRNLVDGEPFRYRPDGAPDAAAARRAYAHRHATAMRHTRDMPGLTGPVTTVKSVTVQRPVGATTPFPENKFWLVGRTDDFGRHLRVQRGPSGPGVWLPDSYATANGLDVGDEFEIATMELINGIYPVRDPAGPPPRLRVAAVYTDLRNLPDEPYWCTLLDTYRIQIGDRPLLPVAFVDLDTFVDASVSSPLNGATEFIDLELADPRLTTPRAHEVADRIAGATAALRASGGISSAHVFPKTISALAVNADRADLVHATLVRTVLPAALAGTLIGLLVVAAAAGYWTQRRRQELRLLAAHGAGPLALGAKAGTESALALAAGCVAGGFASWALVAAVGPSDVFSGEARPLAITATAGCVAACLVVTIAVAAVAARNLADAAARPQRPARLRRIAPGAALAGAALAAVPLLWWLLGTAREHADRVGGVGAVAHVPVRLVVVPIVAFVAVTGVLARLGETWLRRRAAAAPPRSTARYLAGRRLGRPALAGAILGAATALPVALAGFGATVADSTRLTLHAKGAMILGADTVATLNPVGADPAVPAGLAGRATAVLRLNAMDLGGWRVDVLGIDPATFAHGAFWDRQVPGPDLAGMVAGLHAGPQPNGLSYGALPAGRHRLDHGDQPVTTVDTRTVPLLPGAGGGYPVLLVHRDALGELAGTAERQMWISGDPATARTALHRAGLPVMAVRVPEDSYGGGSVFESVTFTFQYLVALAVFIGLIGAVGLLLYLEARAPVHRRGYVLLRRMGLRERTHLAALYAEIAGPLAAGLLGGLLMAAALVLAGRGEVDLSPRSPPGVLLTVPAGVLLVMAGTVTAVSAGATVFAQLRLRRASPGEVLRAAE